MKKTIPATLMGLALLLAGCVVTSIYPFYTEKDVVFDPALLGKWIESGKNDDSEDVIEFKKDEDKAYVLATTEDHVLANRYIVHLFQLGDQRFIDLFPTQRPNGDSLDFAPVHQLMKVAVTGKSLAFNLQNLKWLEELVAKEPDAIRHIKIQGARNSEGKIDERTVLTATTKELQEFVRKTLSVKEAWGEPAEYRRVAAKP
jgi:hypothetical protein